MMPPRDQVARLRALPDPALRRGTLARTLAEADPESVAMLLGYLVVNAAHEDARMAWLDAVVVLLGDDAPLAGDAALAVVQRLQAHPAHAVAAFLAVDPAERRGPDVAGDGYELEDVALGLRKARARNHSRDVLRVMTADPDPSVVRILLENPLAGEAEALRVAARRPQAPGTFLGLLASTRFGMREAVQFAVVANPWCPVRTALAAVPLLSRAHLAEVAEASTLDDRLREAATVVGRVRRR